MSKREFLTLAESGTWVPWNPLYIDRKPAKPKRRHHFLRLNGYHFSVQGSDIYSKIIELFDSDQLNLTLTGTCTKVGE